MPGQVRAIFEDHRGTIWFGTTAGLFFWSWQDGTLRRFAGDPELAQASVGCMAEDTAGALWVGTHGQGLQRLEAGQGERAIRFAAACAPAWLLPMGAEYGAPAALDPVRDRPELFDDLRARPRASRPPFDRLRGDTSLVTLSLSKRRRALRHSTGSGRPSTGSG